MLGQLKKDTHANVDFDVVLEGGTEDGDPSPEKKVQRQDEEDVRAVGRVVPVRQQYHSFHFQAFSFLIMFSALDMSILKHMIATLLKLDIRQIKVEKKILICVIFLDCESAEQNRTKICYEYFRIFFHIKKFGFSFVSK